MTTRRDFLKLLALGAATTAAGLVIPETIAEPRRRWWAVPRNAPVVGRIERGEPIGVITELAGQNQGWVRLGNVTRLRAIREGDNEWEDLPFYDGAALFSSTPTKLADYSNTLSSQPTADALRDALNRVRAELSGEFAMRPDPPMIVSPQFYAELQEAEREYQAEIKQGGRNKLFKWFGEA